MQRLNNSSAKIIINTKSIFLSHKRWLKLVELYLYEFKDTFDEN